MNSVAVMILLIVGLSSAQAQRPLDSWVGAQKVVKPAWDTTLVTSRPGGWPVFLRIHADSIGAADTVYVAKDTDVSSSQLFRIRSRDTIAPVVIGPTLLSKVLLKSSAGDTLKVRLMVY